MVPTEEKAAKETTVTLFHGSKAFVVAFVICFSLLSLIAGSLVARKKSELNLYEKKYQMAVMENDSLNQKERAGLRQ